jgi:hypothetical protein
MRVRECGAGRSRTTCGTQRDQAVVLVGRAVMERGVNGHDKLALSEITNSFVNVGVDAVIGVRQAAGGEQLRAHVLHVVLADGVGEDGQQVIDAGARASSLAIVKDGCM